jgi:hypothetical protein
VNPARGGYLSNSDRYPPRSISAGAAGAWWPIQSSKLAGRGSPPLGRFDSFAASWLKISPFLLLGGAAGDPRRALRGALSGTHCGVING